MKLFILASLLPFAMIWFWASIKFVEWMLSE